MIRDIADIIREDFSKVFLTDKATTHIYPNITTEDIEIVKGIYPHLAKYELERIIAVGYEPSNKSSWMTQKVSTNQTIIITKSYLIFSGFSVGENHYRQPVNILRFASINDVVLSKSNKLLYIYTNTGFFEIGKTIKGEILAEVIKNIINFYFTETIAEKEMEFIKLKQPIIEQKFEIEKSLEEIIGLENVKDYLRRLDARIRMNAEREKLGLKSSKTQSMHMIFKGNPGTGKTKMARIVAETLFNAGIIKENKLIETDRAGLVAGYVGQTALQTTNVLEKAMDGVLFIDEAYALSQSDSPSDFGQEAIDTIVKFMDDNRDRIVVILAGYSDDMDKFLQKNAGLQSRFANIIEFPDYSTEELLQIAVRFYQDEEYVLTDKAKEKLRSIFDKARSIKNFGNGRFARNVFEKSINNMAFRISNLEKNREVLTEVTEEDIEKISY